MMWRRSKTPEKNDKIDEIECHKFDSTDLVFLTVCLDGYRRDGERGESEDTVAAPGRGMIVVRIF